MKWQKYPRRIPEEKVFVARKLSKEVTALTIAKVIQRDPGKSRDMLQPVSRNIGNVFNYNYRKLNDRHLR